MPVAPLYASLESVDSCSKIVPSNDPEARFRSEVQENRFWPSPEKISVLYQAAGSNLHVRSQPPGCPPTVARGFLPHRSLEIPQGPLQRLGKYEPRPKLMRAVVLPHDSVTEHVSGPLWYSFRWRPNLVWNESHPPTPNFNAFMSIIPKGGFWSLLLPEHDPIVPSIPEFYLNFPCVSQSCLGA